MNEPMIKKVKNGYMVIPNHPDRAYVGDENVAVFETWEKMIAYLYKELHSVKSK
jgi:hypothetical protein